MKTINNFIFEKLKLNNQSKLQKKEWSIKDAKRGDIIMVSNMLSNKKDLHKRLFIFKCILKNEWGDDVVGLYAYYSCNSDIIGIIDKNSKSHIGEVNEYIKGTYKSRLATDAEKKLFFNKLNKEGFRWNENKKEIEKI